MNKKIVVIGAIVIGSLGFGAGTMMPRDNGEVKAMQKEIDEQDKEIVKLRKQIEEMQKEEGFRPCDGVDMINPVPVPLACGVQDTVKGWFN